MNRSNIDVLESKSNIFTDKGEGVKVFSDFLANNILKRLFKLIKGSSGMLRIEVSLVECVLCAGRD